MKKILLNNSPFSFSESGLPCLINGKDGSGASMFSISVMANLFKQENKILFICAFPMAKEEMEKQTNVIGGVNIIYITGESESQILNIIDTISDINERIILLKNIETFPRSVFEKLKSYKNIVFSGNLDECEFRQDILDLDLKTKINFENYEGIFDKGIVKLQ